ncbi:hypothetical protein ACFL59_14415 [Planctomycetota bacterium]
MAKRASGSAGFGIKRALLRLLSHVAVALARLGARLPDAAILALLGAAQSLVRRCDPRGEGAVQLDDVRAVFAEDPKGSRVLRRIILETRRAQLVALIEGVLKHHLLADEPAPAKLGEPRCAGVARSSAQKARIGFLGSGHELELLKQAYEQATGCEVMTIAQTGGELPSGLSGLEVGYGTPVPEEWLASALRRGVGVSLHHSGLGSRDMLGRLRALSDQGRAPLRVFYPYLHYAPVRRVKELLTAGEIGEVCAIRVRATIGGRGGALAPEIPERNGYGAHPAFDHFMLLVYLGGAAEAAAAYLNPMDATSGGQGLISCKFGAAGRYGLMEWTFAPEMYIRSEHYPYDLEVEIAGSDGLIWLQRGMAQRTRAAPVYVRSGRHAFPIGAESGLPDDWGHVYLRGAEHFLGLLQGRGRPLMSHTDLLAAVTLKERVDEAARANGVVVL